MRPSARLLLAALLVCVTLLQSPTAVSANRFTVGNSKGWNPGVNYTIWAQNKSFYVGDWLGTHLFFLSPFLLSSFPSLLSLSFSPSLVLGRSEGPSSVRQWRQCSCTSRGRRT